MDFRIVALPATTFAALYGLHDANLAARGVRRLIAGRQPGFPCRVSLADAAPGETLLLMNYEHLPEPSPYRSSHAIFVREHAVECKPAVNEIPEVLARRLLSVRAFDAHSMMLEADVSDGSGVASLISRYLGDARVAFVHLHNAKPGCYAARAVRA